MNPDQSTKIIDKAGGDAAFARLLGIDSKDGFQQRVNNWRRRGLPSDVVLEHYDLIKELQSKVETA